MTLIVKFIKRCALACILSCTFAVSPSLADICFLPTGTCEQGAVAKTATHKTCDDYIKEGIYFATKQENMSCSLANIPGCELYECTVKSCEARGFKLGPTKNKNTLPMGYPDDAWKCESCKQGANFFWKCTPKPCEQGLKTIKECSETESFVESSTPTHKSGADLCGTCVPNSEMQCPDGSETSITPGCYECTHVGDTGYGGNHCYKCKSMGPDYSPEAEFLAVHDSSCYDFKTKRAADGGLCYKGVKMTCNEDSDQYLNEEVVNGKTLCKCRDYKYTFKVEPSLLSFDAAGGTKEFNVTSLRIGTEPEPWDYDVSTPSCPCTIDKSVDKVAVTCLPNPSENNVGCALTLIQTRGDTSIETITVGIRVNPDSCEVGQLSTICADSKCIAQPNGKTSVAGQTCYDCNNNECSPGYTPGEPPAAAGYDVDILKSGTRCYKAIEVVPDAELCPPSYFEEKQTCGNGYKEDSTSKSDGSLCYRCISEQCPAGKSCTDDPVCPSGKVCTDKVDCKTIQIGDVVKYYDCKCKASAINCGDGYDVDDENCTCTSKRCDIGYDERITTCESGWKLDEPKGKSGDLDCNRCIEETCPSGQTCKPWPYCSDGTDCTPNPNIECDTVKVGADLLYTNCKCKISASSCGEGYDFDSNRCECRESECPIGYKTETTSCTDGYDFTTSGKAGEKDCGKCTAKTCPAGQICTTDPICPNGQSCPNNPDITCDKIMLGDEAKYTNCRCTLSGTKNGYTLNADYCKWEANTCPNGTATEFSAAACPTGNTGGYQVVDTTNYAGDKVCKRCDENTCPSGKSCTPTPINPGDGGDATGNPNVSCQKIKLGANWYYYDCTCNVSDTKCGTGKKANTRACVCETCEGKLQSELYGAMTCEKITCGGQTRYKNCVPWGSQWKPSPNSKCNESKLSDDGNTYYDTSLICQCKRGYNSSSCNGKCASYEKCMTNGTANDDGASCYECKDDECDGSYVKEPNQCTSQGKEAKQVDTTEAGSKCYDCISTCSKKNYDGYPYAESEFIKSSPDYYEEFDPGCGAEKRYKCAGGATAVTQPNGKTVCTKTGNSGQKTKSDCDKELSSSDGWEYLGVDYPGTTAAREYMDKYKWPSYHYEIKSCAADSHTYMYGRKYSTVCNVYNYCYEPSSNFRCFQTNQVFNMENQGFCCETSGNRANVYGSSGVITTTDEYCCYKGEGCPTSRIATSDPAANQQPVSKCSKGVEVPKDQMSKYTKACGDSHMVPECKAPTSDSDYLCCTCTQRPNS